MVAKAAIIFQHVDQNFAIAMGMVSIGGTLGALDIGFYLDVGCPGRFFQLKALNPEIYFTENEFAEAPDSIFVTGNAPFSYG